MVIVLTIFLAIVLAIGFALEDAVGSQACFGLKQVFARSSSMPLRLPLPLTNRSLRQWHHTPPAGSSASAGAGVGAGVGTFAWPDGGFGLDDSPSDVMNEPMDSIELTTMQQKGKRPFATYMAYTVMPKS
jgi:hypothetical protein